MKCCALCLAFYSLAQPSLYDLVPSNRLLCPICDPDGVQSESLVSGRVCNSWLRPWLFVAATAWVLPVCIIVVSQLRRLSVTPANDDNW